MKGFVIKFFIFFTAGIMAAPGFAAAATGLLPRNLSLGSVGSDVAVLQSLLNRDADTALALEGPGSAGEETRYFGPLTARAVTQFQEKYLSDILAPAGLSVGTGYFGSFTRRKLTALYPTLGIFEKQLAEKTASAAFSEKKDIGAEAGLSFTPGTDETVFPESAAGQNPNLENLEWYLAAVRDAGAKQGASAEEQNRVLEYIRTTALSTTTDFRAKFLSEIKVAEEKRVEVLAASGESGNLLNKLLSGLNTFSKKLFPTANAGMGVPFGGKLMFAIPCICTFGEIWSVGLIPTGPTYAPVLDYAMGSQMYSNYSAPFALDFLGEYWPGVPTCWQGFEPFCFLEFSYGLMSPTLGTSI